MKLSKKYVAEAIVLTVATCGIAFGGLLLYGGITCFFDVRLSGYLGVVLRIFVPILFLILGGYVIYISYLLARSSYRAIKPLSVLIALALFSWLSPVTNSLAIKASDRGMTVLAITLGIAAWPLAFLGYGLSVRVLKILCAIRTSTTDHVKTPNSQR